MCVPSHKNRWNREDIIQFYVTNIKSRRVACLIQTLLVEYNRHNSLFWHNHKIKTGSAFDTDASPTNLTIFRFEVYIYIFIYLYIWTRWWSYFLEGLLSTGPTPSSLWTSYSCFSHLSLKTLILRTDLIYFSVLNITSRRVHLVDSRLILVFLKLLTDPV